MAANSQPDSTQAEMVRVLHGAPTQDRERAERERIARVCAVRGKYARVPTSSDDFAKLKQEEIEREEQNFARLFPDAT